MAAKVMPNGKTITVDAVCQSMSTAQSGLEKAMDFVFIVSKGGQEYWARDVIGSTILPGQSVTITFTSTFTIL